MTQIQTQKEQFNYIIRSLAYVGIGLMFLYVSALSGRFDWGTGLMVLIGLGLTGIGVSRIVPFWYWGSLVRRVRKFLYGYA